MEDIDKEQLGDPYANAEYAKDIFEYMRGREVGDAWLGVAALSGEGVTVRAGPPTAQRL